jgi:predicted transcriptional regulator
MPDFLKYEYMKQLLIEIDEETFGRLERIAPARSRRRSAFIRAAIHKALSEAQEHATAEAYRRIPDSADEAWFDPRVWEPKAPAYRRGRSVPSTRSPCSFLHHVSTHGRFLCVRRGGGGTAFSKLRIHRRDSAGSMTSSISKCVAVLSALPCS